MKKVTVFDFDGTLTLKDSMMSIIIYQRGRVGLLWALLRQIHLIIFMFMGLYTNHKTKQKLLFYCFGKMTETEFCSFCQQFADSNKHIMRHETMQKLQEAKQRGEEVIVITASPEIWVAFFVPDTTVLGTKLNFSTSSDKDFFLSRNCYGQEKVNRLIQYIPDLVKHRSEYHITAYGDSRGDKEMLEFADEGHLVNGKWKMENGEWKIEND